MNANVISIYKTKNCSLIHRADCSALDECGLRTAEDDKYWDGVGTGTTVQKVAGNGVGMGNPVPTRSQYLSSSAVRSPHSSKAEQSILCISEQFFVL